MADLKQLAVRWFDEVWNQGNTATIDELFPPQGVMHGLGPDIVGPQAYKMYHAGYRTAFPDFHMRIDDMVVEGDTIAIRWTASGTHSGNAPGMAATNLPATFTGMSFARVENGKLVESWNAFDELGMMRQLNMLP